MNKSELKRQCVQNPLDMAEEIDRLTRLCEAKDAEISGLRLSNALVENSWKGEIAEVLILQQQLSESQTQIAMKDEALSRIISENLSAEECADIARPAISETIAAFRTKETEPLRREVAMLRSSGSDYLDIEDKWRAGYEVDNDDWRKIQTIFRLAISNTQATALAYEREVTERTRIDTLKDVKERISNDTASAFDWIYKELRAANKGEVK